MSKHRISMRAVLAALGFAATLALAGSSALADGKQIFVDQKCAKCHSAPGVKGGDKKDLTGVGKRHDAAWLKKFLLKEEALDGKKHKKKFTGTEAELDELVKWLASLK